MRRAREAAPARDDGQIEITVSSLGEVELPQTVVERLRLAPGDLLSIEPGPIALRLEIYREFLAGGWEGFSPETAWHFVEDFLARPLTALLPAGCLPIPEDLLAVASGDSMVLQIVCRGLSHELYLSREETDGCG